LKSENSPASDGRRATEGEVKVTDYQRHIVFEGCFNFRDLGGYQAAHGSHIRWRKLFRSMTPEWMTERDVERARALHIELIIDLRGPDAPGSGPLGLPPTRRVAVGPSLSRSWTSAQEQLFRAAPPEVALPTLLERSAPAFCQAVVVLAANPSRNVLFHCRLGKDRTGVVSALLLKLFGVSDA
jgi:protein-tyrosine phosphatase